MLLEPVVSSVLAPLRSCWARSASERAPALGAWVGFYPVQVTLTRQEIMGAVVSLAS